MPADNVSFDDLAMVAPDEGWAVGALGAQWPPDSAGQGPAGVIYHLTDGAWQRLPQVYPGAELATISMGAPDDGWAASTSAMAGTGSGSGDHVLVLHESHGRWTPVDVPALDAVLKGPAGSEGGHINWINIQMFGPNAGWMFAWTNIPRDPSNPASRAEVLVLRYQQGVWTPIAAPAVTPTTELFSLSAVSADEAWMVGTEYGTNNLTTLFAHYTNGGWSLWPKTFPGVTERLTMLSPTQGWAFDSDAQGGGSDSLLHFDGTTWAPVATPDWPQQRIELTALAFIAAPGVTWFGAAHVEGFGGTARLEQYAAGRWQQVAWPYADVQPERLAVGSAGEFWGIGAIRHQEGCPPALVTEIAQGVFLHDRQGSWSREVLP
ncbi:MAG TPA: hypothetical protein VGR57_17015 [Ktedonobacterales bacterium]|nr:hypothetical protein [Ktedonobacterales bacterium]